MNVWQHCEGQYLIDDRAIPRILLEKIVSSARIEFGISLAAIVVGGSRIRGNWRSESDLDVHIIHKGDWRQKRIISPRLNPQGIGIDVTVIPLSAIQNLCKTQRGYASFYADGILVYPDIIAKQIAELFDEARAILDSPPRSVFEGEEHYQSFLHLDRVIRYALEGDAAEHRITSAYVLGTLAVLRLILGGEHHIRQYELLSQLECVDKVFALELARISDLSDPLEMLRSSHMLLRTITPKASSMIGPRRSVIVEEI